MTGAVEQKKETTQQTATMTEAGFSLNVKMIDKFGQEVMLTFRAPMVNQAEKLILHYGGIVEQLINDGWRVSGGARASQESSQAAAAGDVVPTCKIHGSRMKESRKPGSYYCPRKEGDAWCKEKVG